MNQEKTDKMRDAIKKLSAMQVERGVFKTQREAEQRIAAGVERSQRKSGES